MKTMTVGLLWFDNSSDILAVKVKKATDYYFKKYGKEPNLCLVHPKMLEGIDIILNTIPIRPYRAVPPGHLWIGVEDDK